VQGTTVRTQLTSFFKKPGKPGYYIIAIKRPFRLWRKPVRANTIVWAFQPEESQWSYEDTIILLDTLAKHPDFIIKFLRTADEISCMAIFGCLPIRYSHLNPSKQHCEWIDAQSHLDFLFGLYKFHKRQFETGEDPTPEQLKSGVLSLQGKIKRYVSTLIVRCGSCCIPVLQLNAVPS
jgi:hypothetical protein